MNENKHLEEREIIIPHVKLALCFTEAKTTLLSFKGKEDINLDNVLLSDYPQRLHQLLFPTESKSQGQSSLTWSVGRRPKSYGGFVIT